ncbi:MAG: hypothetical protein IMF08_09875 [Proteobacteria bacterium]|nr:hypothetical protein [Pseudomonadota bacterium]
MTRRISVLFVALAMFMGSASGYANAAETIRGASEGKVEYRILHSKYDEIGSDILTFSRNGEDLIVDVAINIEVKFLFITVHSLVSERRETWRNGRFVAYKAHTDENSDLIDVTARTERGKFVVEGPSGRAEADVPVFPTNPWNPEIVNSTVQMDTKTGELLNATVALDGAEIIEVAGRAIETSKYKVTGDLERELWFDANGNWIQLRFPKDGETLTFTRVTPLE